MQAQILMGAISEQVSALIRLCLTLVNTQCHDHIQSGFHLGGGGGGGGRGHSPSPPPLGSWLPPPPP